MQIRHVYIFMGLLTWACRQPDRQSPIEPTAPATVNEGVIGSRIAPNEPVQSACAQGRLRRTDARAANAAGNGRGQLSKRTGAVGRARAGPNHVR